MDAEKARRAASRPISPADFRRFWIAAAISNLGDGIRLAALPLLALDLTSDTRLIAGVTAMSFAPWIVVGPFAGVLVDRRDRKTLIVAAQLGRGVAVAVLAVTVAIGWANIALLYVVALAVGVGETVVDSASQAAIPHLVDDSQLERANARMTVAENLFNDVVGVALGAVVFAWLTSVPFYVDAATFMAGALLLTSIRQPLQGERRSRDQTVRRDVADGLAFLLHHPFLRPLAFSVATTNIALHMGLSIMVVLLVGELGASQAAFGVVLALGSAGGVLGSLIAGPLVTRMTAQTTLRYTHLPFILAAAVYVTATQAWMVASAFAATSFALVLYQIPSRAMRQRIVPERLLGRVITAFRVFGLGGPVVGAPIGGLMAHQFGVRSAYAASCAFMIAAWAFVLVALRHEGGPPVPIDGER